MPTKSISKVVVIKDKKTAERFIRALEESAAHPGCEVHSDMKVSYANADEVRKMFKKD